MIKRGLTWLMLLTAIAAISVQAQPAPGAHVQTEVRLGVLAHRPKPLIEAQWVPLIGYLNHAIPGIRFSLRALNYHEMETAVAQRKVDVVLAQPAFYIYLSHRYGLSSPMATRIGYENGVPTPYFGAAIVVRNDRGDLKTLADLKGKRLATPSLKTFGGYLMVAYELQAAGMALPKTEQLVVTGTPHDKAIMAVMNGLADAACVRAGVVEDMLQEGKLKAGQFRIIHQQDIPGQPFVSSTRLYPEWPVAALPHLDVHLTNKIAAALLMLPHRGAIAKKIGFEGFNTPMDYRPVVDVLMALREPPFDAAPQFTLGDIWKKYAAGIVLFGMSLLLVLLLFVLLLRYNRRLHALRLRAEKGDNLLRQLSARVPGMIYQYHVRTDGTSHYPYASDAAERLFGLTPEQLNEDAEHLLALVHPEDVGQFRERIRQSAATMREWQAEYRVMLPNEGIRWRSSSATPECQPDGSIIWHGYSADITARKQAEERNQLLIAALEASANGVAITDLTGRIEWVNSAFCTLTGYSRDELVGKNPRVLKSGQHDTAYYEEMWATLMSGRTWHGEILNRRKDGELSQEELIIAPVKNEKGEIHHFIGIKQDISGRKRMEEELRRQATTDALTGLPNRRQFFNLAEAELSRIKRGKAGMAAIIMLDLDHFKRVNDTYGHHVGDQVLVHLAGTISGTLRRSDFSGRLGGEEFVVLLPETSVEQSVQFAERIREKLEKAVVTTEAGDIHYTASFGVSVMNQADESVSAALDRADQALYRAKENGRNRVEVFLS